MDWDSCNTDPERDCVREGFAGKRLPTFKSEAPLVEVARTLVKDGEKISFIIKIKLETPVPEIDPTNTSFDVPDPVAGEEMDQGVNAPSLEVKKSSDQSQTEAVSHSSDIAIRDFDNLVFRV